MENIAAAFTPMALRLPGHPPPEFSMATKTTDTKSAERDTAVASVIVTPGGVPSEGDGVNDRSVLSTQVMNRAEYAERLAAGASPVADTLLADEPDTTVAITEPAPDTAPAPAVVPVDASLADKADGDAVVTVPKPQATKPTQPAKSSPTQASKKPAAPATKRK